MEGIDYGPGNCEGKVNGRREEDRDNILGGDLSQKPGKGKTILYR